MSRYADDEDRAAVATAYDDEEAVVDSTDAEAEPETPEEGDEGEVEDEPVPAEEEGDEPPEPAAADDAELIEVTINGRVEQVPRDELVKGYLRTADYTRKTQLLAAERKNLHAAHELIGAMERNPAQTITVLAQHYGIDLSDPAAVEDIKPPPPELAKLHDLEAWKEQIEAQQREAAVDAELARLHSVYGEFDEEELFTFAVSNGVGHLETALRALSFDRNGHAKPTKQTEKRKVAGQSPRTNGHSAAVTPKQPPEKISSFRDAYDAAKRELDTGRT